MTEEEIATVEQQVNERIRENIPVIVQEMPKEEALKLGAMALFGEKYGDKVRVVIMNPAYSIELCGGTHVASTGELGYFKILHESAVAAGVRRVEAVSGAVAEDWLRQQFGLMNSIREALKNPKDVLKSLDNLLQENNELKRKIEQLQNKGLQSIKEELLKNKRQLNGIEFIGAKVEVSNADALKKLVFDTRASLENYFVILVADIDGKASVAIGMADEVSTASQLDAGKIIKEHIAPLIKGGGGGQKTLATAGGQDTSKLDEVIRKVESLIA